MPQCVWEGDPYPKLNETCVASFQTAAGVAADDFPLPGLWFQYMGL